MIGLRHLPASTSFIGINEKLSMAEIISLILPDSFSHLFYFIMLLFNYLTILFLFFVLLK